MQNSEAEGSSGPHVAQMDPPTMTFSGPTVIVKVGPDLKEYHVHKELVMYHSGFFRGALSNETFASAQDAVVTLKHVDPPIFEGFAWFLYHGKSSELQEGWNELLLTKLAGFDHASDITFMVTCYVLAHVLIAPLAKAFFLEHAHTFLLKYRPYYELIAFAWYNLPGNSPMLEMLLDAHCEWWLANGSDVEESEEGIEQLPAAFVYRLVVLQRELLRGDKKRCSKPFSHYEELEEMVTPD